MNKKHLFVVVITLVIISSVLLINSRTYFLSTCSQMEKLSEKTTENLLKQCTTDSDCMPASTGWCGFCVNKQTDEKYIKKLMKIYNIGVEKECFPQFECMQFECKCDQGICTKQVIKVK